MQHPIKIYGAEPSRLFVPESPAAVLLHLAGMLAQVGGIESLGAGGDAPLRVLPDGLLDFGQIQQRIVIINGRQRILAAEREQVPIISANSFSGNNCFLAIGEANPAAALVAWPGGIDALAPPGIELVHHIAHR